jgi:ribosomal protein S12 methylthiotransferase
VRFVRDFGFEHMGVFPYSPEPGTPMGRNEHQHDDATKQAWVEELMLTQQDVVFARNEARKGELMRVMIERPAGRDLEDGVVARGTHQAPDIDSVVFVESGKKLTPGDFVDVKITDYQAYDLVAKVPSKKGRSLAVVKS